MRAGQVALNDVAERSMADATRPEDRLALLVSGLVLMHAKNPMSARVSDIEVRALTPGSPAHTEIVGLRDTYEAVWHGVLREGCADGVFETSDERLTRLGLLTMCTGMSEWYRPMGEENLAHICSHFIAMALSAVRARRGAEYISPADVPMVAMELVPLLPWEPTGEGTADLEVPA
jgi:hypothetical protein